MLDKLYTCYCIHHWKYSGILATGGIRVGTIVWCSQVCKFLIPDNAPAGARAVSRQHRPPELVAVYAISSICYSRNRNAKLLPADKALLLFACRANRYLFSHESRIGASISYNATLDMLEKYAAYDAEAVLELGWSDKKSGILRFDNMQKQVKPRYQRIGREAVMLIGCAGTYCEGEGFSDGALSLKDKREWVTKNLREQMTFETLWDLVDHHFLANVLPLVWLEILFLNGQEIPEFSSVYAENLQELYSQIGTKHKVTPRQTKIYPLKTNGYNETITGELFKAVSDFFTQLGQTSESFNPRLILAGGDGLTYERMVQLKNYLQFQDNEFERMEILEPFLEIWHTIWTNLSRIYEAHWVSLTSADPSTLGFGANTLKRKAPGNVSKVDYYPYVDLLDTQVEARILDIWSNELETKDLFSELEAQSKVQQLPTFEELHHRAINLQSKYRTRKAFQLLMYSGDGYTAGTPWTPRPKDESSAQFTLRNEPKKKGKKKGNQEVPESEEPFHGDETLARSTRLINDGLLSNLINSAVRRGDVGCVWECMKMMTFTFAGSLHTKYTGYLLEMISNFELEASPKLRDYFFENWLISINGRTFEPGDLFQEQLQEEIYEHVDHDQGFDAPHTRTRISPNVFRFKKSKIDNHAGLGLAARSGNHHAPSRRADIQKLMSRYQMEEVHLFRQGRQYEEVDSMRVDDHGRGVASLMQGRLAKWVHDTMWVRNLDQTISQAEQQTEPSIHTFDTAPPGLNVNNNLSNDGFAFDPNQTGECESHVRNEDAGLQTEDHGENHDIDGDNASEAAGGSILGDAEAEDWNTV
ncbi:hypothetical protein FB446DRAFT_654037 [Lentinula raphanica]|nr:hypothetical protein FB446DRAFT_654037 [Lentinula raphanica]